MPYFPIALYFSPFPLGEGRGEGAAQDWRILLDFQHA